ncbi:MAG: iron-sulfur cluster assembly scaffold protein [Chloroflexi bacterium]|nr:iron-sulfur cluster assembly scaffold protein [Chloroflexota bacterium]
MDRQGYIEEILDHYQHPRHKGVLDPFDSRAEGGNPGCGDQVTVYLRLGPDGHISEASFEGQGCTISMAGASMLTEMVVGKTPQEVQDMNYEDFVDHMGREIVVSRVRCATLGLGALKAAADLYLKSQRT